MTYPLSAAERAECAPELMPSCFCTGLWLRREFPSSLCVPEEPGDHQGSAGSSGITFGQGLKGRAFQPVPCPFMGLTLPHTVATATSLEKMLELRASRTPVSEPKLRGALPTAQKCPSGAFHKREVNFQLYIFSCIFSSI